MRAQSRCYCGGHMVAVIDSESGLARIKCDSPYHGRGQRDGPVHDSEAVESILSPTVEILAPDGTLHVGLVTCQKCHSDKPIAACNCGFCGCAECWTEHRKTCKAA